MQRRLKRSLHGAMAMVLLALGSGWLAAQGTAAMPGAAELPESPGNVRVLQATPAQVGSGSVSGTVLDINGGVVPDARVTLAGEHGVADRIVITDDQGRFVFTLLAPEKLRVTITATGLETFVSNEIHLATGEKYVLPNIALPVEPANATMQVTVTEDQLATEQVKAQEKQRVLGVIPNFYTSFIWNAAPMRTKQKFRLVLRSSIDPVVFVTVGIRAGVEQVRNTDPGYGDGAQGFFERYGAAYGDSITGRVVGGAILPSLLHQDPRYFYRGTGSVASRAWYAISRAVVCRGDNGKAQPNYSHVLGNFAAAGLRNVYLAPEDRKGATVVLNGFTVTGYNAISNLIREFLFRSATTNVPDYAKGKVGLGKP